MATSSISAGDLANIRADQYIDNLALHITPLNIVKTGTITAVPTVSPYVSVTWDGSTSGISVGQMVKVVSGSTLKSYGVIRKAPSGSTLFISTTPLGSAGVATRIEVVIAVNDVVTVYSHRPIWNLYSRISDSTFYKSWDIPYTNQNSQPPPVCNVGTWQAAILATGVTAETFTLPRNGVNTSFALGSATISSYSWVLPTGVTFASGFSATDDVIDVVAEAGYHQVSCLLTDSNSSTHVAYLWLFVSDGTTGASLSERYAISDMSGSSGRQGTEVSFTITGENLEDVLYPSAGILLREFPIYNSTTLSNGVAIDTFVGYIHPDGLQISYDGNIGTATVKAVSPFLYAEKVGQPQQALSEVASPAHWAECTTVLSHPLGYLYYAMKWHAPNIIDMHDLDAASFTTPRRHHAKFDTNNLAGAMTVSANYLAGGNVGSASDGTTVLRDNPMYMDNSDRNALAVVITWQEQDMRPEINYPLRFGSNYAESRAGGFVWDGTSDKAWLAGRRWGQGVSTVTLPDFSVTVAQGVDRIKAVSGHYLAEQNSDIPEMILELNANQDVIDPVYMLWNRLNISAEFDPNGVGFTNERMLATQVSRSWELTNNGWMKRLSLGLQPETFGQAGEEIPISSGNTWTTNGWSPNVDVPFEPFQDDSAFNGLMVTNDDNGKMAVSQNFFASSVNYTDLSASMNNETVCDFAIDFDSPYYSGNDITAALRFYAVTISGTTITVWRFNDIQSSTIATQLTTYTMADSTCDSEARIVCSETTPTYVAVGWHDRTGTEFGYSSDSGDTWQAKANVGSTVTDTANDNAPLGMAIDGNITLISAPDSTPEYGIYKATSVGGAFSAVTNTERNGTVQPLVKIEPQGTKGYVSTIGAATGAIVTFDAGGLAYTLPMAQIGTVQSGGNPNDCLKATSVGVGSYISVEVDLGSSMLIPNIEFDYYEASGGSAEYEIYLDTILVAGATLVFNDVWRHLAIVFGASGQVVEIRLKNTVSTVPDLRLDNVDIDGASGGGNVTSLFSVDPITGSAVWTDITPATGEAPERSHDLSIGLIDNQVIDTVSGNSNNWYSSADGGTNWSTSESASAKRAFYTAGETLLEGGNGEIKISYDSGSSFTDLTGNLASVWGSIGVIKKVVAI